MSVSYRVADGIARIELDRPDVANAVDLDTAHALGRAVSSAGTDEEVRAVLLTGAGRRFCAGGDVRSMVASDDREAYLFELAQTLDGALQALADLEKPVVAAVQGAVAGAGLGVMLSCDLAVAEPGTKLAMAYAGVGLTPDCGVSWLLPRAVGQQRALDLALTGRVLTAAEALDWGLVTYVAEDARGAAEALVTRLSAGSPFALGQARRLLRGSWNTSRGDAGHDESRTIAAAVSTPYATEALKAFAPGATG